MQETISRHAPSVSRPAGPVSPRPEPPSGPPSAPESRRPAESAHTLAAVSVLLGAVGLFIFNLIFGPLAIGLAVAALRRQAGPGRHPASARTRAGAWAGLVLGAADLIVLVVLIAASLAHGAVTWHFGA